MFLKEKIIELDYKYGVTMSLNPPYMFKMNDVVNELKNHLNNLRNLCADEKLFKTQLTHQINRWENLQKGLENSSKQKEKLELDITIKFVMIIWAIKQYEQVDDLDDNEEIILFMASVPNKTLYIRYDKEFQNLHDIIAENPGKYKLIPIFAMTKKKFEKSLMNNKPVIIHFAGHGDVDCLLFESKNGYRDKIPWDYLNKNLIKVKLLYLNACYSANGIDKLSNKLFEFAIGNYDSLDDTLAIDFSERFYLNLIQKKLSYQESYDEAYDFISSKIRDDEYIYECEDKMANNKPDILSRRTDLELSLNNMKFYNNDL